MTGDFDTYINRWGSNYIPSPSHLFNILSTITITSIYILIFIIAIIIFIIIFFNRFIIIILTFISISSIINIIITIIIIIIYYIFILSHYYFISIIYINSIYFVIISIKSSSRILKYQMSINPARRRTYEHNIITIISFISLNFISIKKASSITTTSLQGFYNIHKNCVSRVIIIIIIIIYIINISFFYDIISLQTIIRNPLYFASSNSFKTF